jgi:predicted ribosome quality control (RQC) complex YloA/Tae2 family protein
MDLVVLQHIARELNDLLPGGFINKIHQPLPREIVLKIRSTGGERKLMISADPLLGRIHLTQLKIPNPPRPLRFCAFLRAHLQGSRIIEVKAATDDRVVKLIAARGPASDRNHRELILELLGRDSNIILVDAKSGLIMDCLHHIPEKEICSRAVLPGVEYAAPPRRQVRVTSGEALLPPAARIVPGIKTMPAGKKRLVLQASAEDEAFPTINDAADALYGAKLRSALLEAFRRETAAPAAARIKSLGRRLVKIEEDILRHQQSAQRQADGELLKPNLSSIKKGMKRVEVRDWGTEGTRVIALEPSLDAVANMNLIFKKAAKGKRGEKAGNERLKVTLEEKRALEDLLYFIQEARDIAELEQFASESNQPSKQQRTQPRKQVPKSDAHLVRKFESPSGRTVLVGRSGAGNDYIVRKKAGKGDLWFHAKDVPGAHVILPKTGKQPIITADKEFAAGLAVHFSKASGKGKWEVIVADAGDLGRPKGAVPGQVTVNKYTTMLSQGLGADSPDRR